MNSPALSRNRNSKPPFQFKTALSTQNNTPDSTKTSKLKTTFQISYSKRQFRLKNHPIDLNPPPGSKLSSLLLAATKLWPRLCFYTCVWFCSQGGVSGQGEPLPNGELPPGPDTPPGMETPCGMETPPGADPPPGKETPAHGQWEAGTHPTGMHSCSKFKPPSILKTHNNTPGSKLKLGLETVMIRIFPTSFASTT